MALAFSGLAVCVTSDLQVGLVFDAVMLLASVLFLGVGDGEAWMTALAGSLASSFLVSIPFITTKGRGLGFGDVKLAAFCGLILGYPLSVASVWFAFVIGGTIGVVLIRTKRLRPQASVPFAPFLAAGTGCALLCSRIVR